MVILKIADFIADNLTAYTLAVATLFASQYVFNIPTPYQEFLNNTVSVSIGVVITSALFLLGVTGYRIHKISENPEFDRL